MKAKPRVLIASGFFESDLVSFREYSYSKELAAQGYLVTLMCGDQSYIWSRSRVRLPVTEPMRSDGAFARSTGVDVQRRHVFFRISDFVLYLPRIRDIRQADVVHVIEFRQGVTVLIAVLARIFGKPVVYDHEQRGDRSAHWYSRIDSTFRRLLIFGGAFTVDRVRHTVAANGAHFRSCTPRRVPMTLAPLGADSTKFYFSEPERARVRRELAFGNDRPIIVMSGKLHGAKRVTDVVRASRQLGLNLVLVGTIERELQAALEKLGPGNERLLPQANADGLRALYNAADYALFTTFSVSYWEAHATGVHLLVPVSDFSELVFSTDASVTQFGVRDMFLVPDEEYAGSVDLVPHLVEAIQRAELVHPRRSRDDFSTHHAAQLLSDMYEALLQEKKRAQTPEDEIQGAL